MVYKNAGFAFLRLLVLALVAGVVAVVGWQKYREEEAKNQYMRAMVAADSVWRAQQLYRIANGTYAPGFDGLNYNFPAGSEQIEAAGVSGDDVWENAQFQFVLRVEHGEGRHICVKVKNEQNEPVAQYCRPLNESGSVCRAVQTLEVWNNVCVDFGGQATGADGHWNSYDL